MFNDSLDDLIGNAADAIRNNVQPVQPPASYKQQDFTEPCKSCRGSGSFYSYSGRYVGPCFKCKGAGKHTFKTSPVTRAQARVASVVRKAEKSAAALETFKAEHPAVWAWMDGSTFPFAVSLRDALAQYGSLTDNQLAAALRCIAKLEAVKAERVAREENAPVADTAGVDRLKAAFDAAAAFTAAKGKGLALRNPKITIGGIAISPAKASSKNAGALYVKAGTQYLGKIAGGKFHAVRECTPEQSAKVLAFLADPKAAAVAYGQETGVCCVCNATLTSKWRLQGIGPICAQKFGWGA